uniref:Uncharacterized protein n=1 Tax=Terrapene triunguis TaxID=2587831 RepID=A0A674IHY9_9SAUR
MHASACFAQQCFPWLLPPSPLQDLTEEAVLLFFKAFLASAIENLNRKLLKMETTQRNVPTYLALSIFNLLCCCLPLGIAALIFSLRVENAAGTGDMERASQASRTARMLNIIGIVVGVIFLIIIIVVVVVGRTAK